MARLLVLLLVLGLVGCGGVRATPLPNARAVLITESRAYWDAHPRGAGAGHAEWQRRYFLQHATFATYWAWVSDRLQAQYVAMIANDPPLAYLLDPATLDAYLTQRP